MIVLPPKRNCRLRFRYVPVHKFPQPGTDVHQRFKQGFAHSASCAQDGNVQPSDMVVYSRNSKAPCQYYSESMKKRLTCRMMNGVKTQFTSNDAALASSQITYRDDHSRPQDSFCAAYRTHPVFRRLYARCVIAAHIIHQMHQPFQRRLSSGPCSVMRPNSGAGSNVSTQRVVHAQ